ncbi:retrovirus-related pol polyprotein from transposon TNT 1-94 [Tanacetum coccineum]|uniref:Retrovirus-related pol polyprotein from transposon TNT 1-94 n=1 Tax=Tanacetum coccineum TaxID=301880 RepID=A0ABQ5AIC6_9ASTR
MLRKTPNKVYDPYLKAGLGYKNPERLKKVIAAQPKMYDGEKLHSAKLVIDSPDSEETLEDAKESRLKMRNKMVQINYAKLNALYKTFVPQQDFSVEQTYFSIPLLLLMLLSQKQIDNTLLEDRQRRWMSYSQNSLREFYKTDVIPMFASLSNNLKELKEELIEEVHEMLNIFESMVQKVDGKSSKENILQKEIDRLLEVSLTIQVTPKISKPIYSKKIKILEYDFKRSQAQSIDFELKLQHQKEKMACDVSWKSKLPTINDENVLLKTQVDFVVKERENIKLEYQKLFNSIKATQIQHQKEFDELIQHVNQKTYAYADVRAQNQDLLITISELKNKLKIVDKGKNVNTNRSKPVTSHPTPNNEQSRTQNENVLARGIKTAQSLPSETKSRIRVHSTSNTSVTTQKWIAKLSTLPSVFVSCDTGTVCFKNDHFAAITGYGDYVQGNLTICHVYYVEGLGQNLFSVGQFCDGDLEVAFRSNTCYVQNLEGDDLLTGSCDLNLYTISISEIAASSPVCLMSRATSTKSWLWHRRLSYLNFSTINQLTSTYLVDGLSKFKYNKDHLCSACEQCKSKKASLPPKLVPSTESKLELLHMDLCEPMRVASINGKKYILVIVDDYSRYTWVYFLRTKDEAPDMIIDFVNQVQRNLKAQILTIRTDNRTEFKNEKLRAFYAKLGIVHKTSIA